MNKKISLGIAVIAVAIISVAAFTISQVITHPTDLSVTRPGSQQDYLVKGVPYNTVNLTMNGVNLTIYLQLITPGGNISSNTPFLIEVNAFVVSNDNSLNYIMVNVAVNHAYLNQGTITIQDYSHSILNGTTYQTTYHSVSTNEAISNSSQFSANVTVSFFQGFGPYYYSVESINKII